MSIMQYGGILCIILLSSISLAGCIQVPGIHVIGDTPDPVIGQWIGGEPRESELHVVFYENGTFLSMNFFTFRRETTDTGTWTKIERNRYLSRSVSGETVNWTYDPSGDIVYVTGIPQKKYYRYKG